MKAWLPVLALLSLALVSSVSAQEIIMPDSSQIVQCVVHLKQVVTLGDLSFGLDGNQPGLLYVKYRGRWQPDPTFAFDGISINALAVDPKTQELLLAGCYYDEGIPVWIRVSYEMIPTGQFIAEVQTSPEMLPDFEQLRDPIIEPCYQR
ncbi:MAG: hypothetical protein PHI73_01855 [Patescibacteria group bacterium]|nr:hypothetical protein [Patescibacteria group bacterium]